MLTYISNSDHYKKVLSRVKSVKQTLWIGTLPQTPKFSIYNNIMENITFDTLNESAKIFDELKNKKPIWWEYCKQDKSFYIELRKDNQVNVYFEGGSIIRVHYCSRHKELQTYTHYKYLGFIL